MINNLAPLNKIKAKDQPRSEDKGAPTIFFLLGCAFMTAINVRIYGTLWAVLLVSLASAILYLARHPLARIIRLQPILVLLPALFVLSAVWSDERFISLSLGGQTFLTTVTAVALAHCCSRRQFISMIFIATSAVCLLSVASGRTGPSATGPVLIGLLGSKNAMGLLAYLAAMTSVSVVFDSGRTNRVRALAVVTALGEAKIAASVNATTAVLSLAMGFLAFLTIRYVLSRSGTARWLGYFLLAFAVIIAVLLTGALSDYLGTFVTGSLGKDMTFTGRTLLWEQARNLFEDSPFLGHGFRAFWVGSSADAHRLLAMMKVQDGRGFQFHEQFLEVLVDTGFLGEIILITTFVTFASKIWKNAIQAPSYFTAYSMAVFIVYVVRWFFETAFLPFSFDMMIFYGLGTVALGERFKKPHIAKQHFKIGSPQPNTLSPPFNTAPTTPKPRQPGFFPRR